MKTENPLRPVAVIKEGKENKDFLSALAAWEKRTHEWSALGYFLIHRCQFSKRFCRMRPYLLAILLYLSWLFVRSDSQQIFMLWNAFDVHLQCNFSRCF